VAKPTFRPRHTVFRLRRDLGGALIGTSSVWFTLSSSWLWCIVCLDGDN
jgi:hypothetical protein